MKKLSPSWQQHLFVKLTSAELYLVAQDWNTAVQQLSKLADYYPGHYAVDKLLAQAYMGKQQPNKAIAILNEMKQAYPTDTQVWYLLSEALGQAGKRDAVHQARIEYFFLTGQIDRAIQQITFARREPNLSSSDAFRLDQLEIEAKQIQDDMKMDI